MRGVKAPTEEARLGALRDAQHRYGRTEKGQQKYARYRDTEGYDAAQARYIASGRRSEIATAHHKKTLRERPEVAHAWQAVSYAVRVGKLAKPLGCEDCGRTQHLVGHHHKGYDPEHRLDVKWLCRPCHKAAHREAQA